MRFVSNSLATTLIMKERISCRDVHRLPPSSCGGGGGAVHLAGVAKSPRLAHPMLPVNAWDGGDVRVKTLAGGEQALCMCRVKRLFLGQPTSVVTAAVEAQTSSPWSSDFLTQQGHREAQKLEAHPCMVRVARRTVSDGCLEEWRELCDGGEILDVVAEVCAARGVERGIAYR